MVGCQGFEIGFAGGSEIDGCPTPLLVVYEDQWEKAGDGRRDPERGEQGSWCF